MGLQKPIRYQTKIVAETPNWLSLKWKRDHIGRWHLRRTGVAADWSFGNFADERHDLNRAGAIFIRRWACGEDVDGTLQRLKRMG